MHTTESHLKPSEACKRAKCHYIGLLCRKTWFSSLSLHAQCAIGHLSTLSPRPAPPNTAISPNKRVAEACAESWLHYCTTLIAGHCHDCRSIETCKFAWACMRLRACLGKSKQRRQVGARLFSHSHCTRSIFSTFSFVPPSADLFGGVPSTGFSCFDVF